MMARLRGRRPVLGNVLEPTGRRMDRSAPAAEAVFGPRAALQFQRPDQGVP